MQELRNTNQEIPVEFGNAALLTRDGGDFGQASHAAASGNEDGRLPFALSLMTQQPVVDSADSAQADTRWCPDRQIIVTGKGTPAVLQSYALTTSSGKSGSFSGETESEDWWA